MLLSVVVAAAIGVTAGLMIWHGRRSALDMHRRGMSSMGIVLVEQTSRYVQVIDMMLREVQSHIDTMRIAAPSEVRGALGGAGVQSYLAERVANVPQVNTLILIDADGIIFNWSRDAPAPSIDTTDRDYYKYFKEHQDRGLFIGSLYRSRGTGSLSLHFARRVTGPGGMFLGIILGNVDINYLSEFYQAAAEHLHQDIALLRHDGTMLMRYPDPEFAIGMKLPLTSPWYASVAAGGSSYVNDAPVRGVASLVSAHLLPDYPLVINILMDKDAVFAEWRQEAFWISGFATAASVAFASLFRALGQQFRRQLEQNVRLAQTQIRLNERKQVFRSYAEMSADWFWEQDEELRFKPNDRISPVVGKTRWDVADPAMAPERWTEHKADLAARRSFRNFRWERIDENGSRRYVSASGDPVFDRNGRFAGYRGTGRIVTAEVEAAAELELGRQKFEAVLSNITQGVCFFDAGKRLQLWNRRFTEVYGLERDALHVGCPLEEIVRLRHEAGSAPDATPAAYMARQERVITAGQQACYILSLNNGRFVSVCHHPMPDGGWVSTHEDITERHQAEASIVFMARHDSLTKLPNRVLFHERMDQAIAMAGRDTQFAVLCVDLDRFKQVNDTMGHPVGDGLLVAVADRLAACVREIDTVARLGGDEFAIIQMDLRHPDDSQVLADRIIAAFEQPFDVDGHQIMTGVSIGVAVAPGDSTSYERLIRSADIALYLAKTEGRGTARFFEPEMDARIHSRRVMEQELERAVDCDQLELYYQPQVNLTAQTLTGFEALLRWRHPVRGFISPMDFVPLAEETGMIVAIGEWVLRTACREAATWPDGISVAVNLSPVQFRKGDLAGVVRSALAGSGLRADRLELEITESVFLGATADTMTTLQAFRAMGISVALDDFGTGYSSLSYLRSFPFNKIKIDQSFVRDLTTSRESLSIVRAVTGLGQSLGMMTIAEGVETPAQLDRLRAEGCTEVQGYLFSQPRPASEVPAMIAMLARALPKGDPA